MKPNETMHKSASGGKAGGKNPNATKCTQHAVGSNPRPDMPPHRAGQIPPKKGHMIQASDFIKS